MKPPILLLALLSGLAFTSCTTAYKSGQTPDDVYYSPAQPQDEYVRVERKDDNRRYEGTDEYYDDRYLRMKVRNRYRWSELDDWYYFGNRYRYSYYANSWDNPWSPYTYWNCTYNPYYHGVVIVNPKSTAYSKPRVFNLNTYNSNALTQNNYTNPKTPGTRNTYTGPRNTYSNSNTNSNSGNILRNIFNNNNSSSNSNSSSNNNSSSTPKTTTSSSSSSGNSGSSAPVRRF